MADTNELLEKAKEMVEKFAPMLQGLKLTGKKEFALSEVVPGWDKIDNKLREEIGLQVKDLVSKKKLGDITQKGQNSKGEDLYEIG